MAVQSCLPGMSDSARLGCNAEIDILESLMIAQWQMFLNRAHPPGAVKNFSATEFALETAVNLRLALKLVKPTTECFERADAVYERAKNYGELRASGSGLVTDAERELADALKLLAIEMQLCDPAWKANEVLIGLELTDKRVNSGSLQRT
ncbi:MULTISPECIES: hypothetical protein [unclassified Sinorhizobium]|uniref:hypothetical protein n=1 Tax=unclassified Sinorhizobium TaxID=2613772 RepID=UPI0035256E5C